MIACYAGGHVSLFFFGKNTGRHRDDLTNYDLEKADNKSIYSRTTVNSYKPVNTGK